jgi:ribosomal-protein-alanine N-acetyltransferase
VVQLDRLAFPTPWPERTYRYEILENDCSRMFVLEPGDSPPLPPKGEQPKGWLDWLLKGVIGPKEHEELRLSGYSGMWYIAGEAHVSTIAVHPDWRGKKLGELLLWTMVRHAIQMNAEQVTLEVRVSNSLAQNLYRKYGFEIMGTRRGYYRDNGEDAYMMGVPVLGEPYHQKIQLFGQELSRVLRVTDRW